MGTDEQYLPHPQRIPAERISDGRWNPAADTDLLLTAYEDGNYLPSDIFITITLFLHKSHK